ncbi:polymeric immunoglobulin receptor-like [Scyliorhinus canicula]|uniref:polymeric immunoglobulin receptor-like n=1 Tax=Scyliorhinus canicula TaxID=7830 RepID=UPI0018F441B8|nr:polymeric immunoglobulin receptor-like [Scyliorhinus canicula]
MARKIMWILILLISSLAISGGLWAKSKVTGAVGRKITVACHYTRQYKQNMKYWCDGRTRECSYLVRTNDPGGRLGRMSIADNKIKGIFVVTLEDLRLGDTGWYSCGIDQPGKDTMFAVRLQIFTESVSVPLLSLLPNVSCSVSPVSVSCESLRGSLPIQYIWNEKTPSGDSKISDTNKLDLRCRSFKQQQHQYYCTASNTQGKQSSQMVNVSVISLSEQSCSYVILNGSSGAEYTCAVLTTISPKTSNATSRFTSVSKSYIIWDVIRWGLFTLLVICAVSVTWCAGKSKPLNDCSSHSFSNVGK